MPAVFSSSSPVRSVPWRFPSRLPSSPCWVEREHCSDRSLARSCSKPRPKSSRTFSRKPISLFMVCWSCWSYFSCRKASWGPSPTSCESSRKRPPRHLLLLDRSRPRKRRNDPPFANRSRMLLEARHVSKRFGGLKAINDVSFAVNPGEVTFIVGPNGAGKTTLFNLITGVYHPDSGSIRFDGQELSAFRPDQAAKLGIGRTFQLVKPLRNLTVLENVMLGAFLHTNSPSKAAEEAREVLRYLQMEK